MRNATSSWIPGDDSATPEHSSMKVTGESPRETCNLRETFAHPKKLIRIGCWNVRTMYDLGKLEQVYREMRNYNLDILGISECT